MQITTIGLDIAKNVFQVHGIDATEKVVVRKQLRRGQLVKFFEAVAPCLVGMEACATAHHWARELTAERDSNAGAATPERWPIGPDYAYSFGVKAKLLRPRPSCRWSAFMPRSTGRVGCAILRRSMLSPAWSDPAGHVTSACC